MQKSQPIGAGARMADISDKLDPEVQAALLVALRSIQEVSVRLSIALEKRADLMAILAEGAAKGVCPPGKQVAPGS